MYSKLPRLNIVLVLGALVGMMIVLSGCGTSAPQPTATIPIPTRAFISAPAGSSACTPAPATCDPPYPCASMSEVVAYISTHYPDQAPQGIVWQETPQGWTAGDWIITDKCERMIVANSRTGFRWEGGVSIRQVIRECFCSYEKTFMEISVTIPTQAIPTSPPTSNLQPTCPPLVCDPPGFPCPEIWDVLDHIEKSYPAYIPKDMTWQKTKDGWVAGDWIIRITCPQVIVINSVSGFRWEGEANWRKISDGCSCRFEKIMNERSVSVPSQSITTPTPTR